MRGGIIGLVCGGIIGFAIATLMNTYGLALIDWAHQDFLSGGTVSAALCTALGAFSGGALGYILSLEKQGLIRRR
jgi:hypothetical protein